MDDLREKPSRVARREIIKILTERDGFSCYICHLDFTEYRKNNPNPEQDFVTVDHYIPLSRGGTWDLSNLKLACQPCNNKKGDKLPNPDGSIPDNERKLKVPKTPRPIVCDTCSSGRLLLEDEECPDCGSGPQPYSFPRFKQRKPKNCDHSVYHCWLCVIGLEPRKPVINDLIMGD